MKASELRILVTLAEDLHFGRAAERLGMAQPQLSETLRRIERDAGLAVFHRRPRVRLTPGGEVLLETARRVLAELESGAQRARAVAAGQTGLVTLGFVPVAMFSDLPQVLRRFLDAHPSVELKLVEGTTGQLRDQLGRGALDLMIARDDGPDEDLARLRFAPDEVNLLLPASHPTARLEQVSPADLAGDAFVFFPRSAGPRYHDRVLRWLREAGLEPRVRRESESWVATAALVGAGLGISLGTRLLARAAIPGAVYRTAAAPPLDVSFWLSWSPGRLIPAAEKLLDLIRVTRTPPLDLPGEAP